LEVLFCQADVGDLLDLFRVVGNGREWLLGLLISEGDFLGPWFRSAVHARSQNLEGLQLQLD